MAKEKAMAKEKDLESLLAKEKAWQLLWGEAEDV